MEDSGLEFFNSLSAQLHIELTVPPRQVAPNLLNLQASPDAKVVNLKLKAEVYDDATDEFRDLTPDELNSIAFRGSEIRLRSEDGQTVSHPAPNGDFFTVRELLLAVELTERQTRDHTEWLGGVDVHHCFFEGIHQAEDGAWEIYWGSWSTRNAAAREAAVIGLSPIARRGAAALRLQQGCAF